MLPICQAAIIGHTWAARKNVQKARWAGRLHFRSMHYCIYKCNQWEMSSTAPHPALYCFLSLSLSLSLSLFIYIYIFHSFWYWFNDCVLPLPMRMLMNYLFTCTLVKIQIYKGNSHWMVKRWFLLPSFSDGRLICLHVVLFFLNQDLTYTVKMIQKTCTVA